MFISQKMRIEIFSFKNGDNSCELWRLKKEQPFTHFLNWFNFNFISGRHFFISYFLGSFLWVTSMSIPSLNFLQLPLPEFTKNENVQLQSDVVPLLNCNLRMCLWITVSYQMLHLHQQFYSPPCRWLMTISAPPVDSTAFTKSNDAVNCFWPHRIWVVWFLWPLIKCYRFFYEFRWQAVTHYNLLLMLYDQSWWLLHGLKQIMILL